MNESLILMYSLIKAYFWRPRWIQEPHPWVGHMPFARWLIGRMRPKIFVELGTHTGNSYFSFCQGVQEKGLKTKCFAVDTWQGDAQAGHYDERVFSLVQKNSQLNYSKFSTLYRMTFDEALGQFQDRSVDLLHIDGLHTYEAVRHDFESWLPKLVPGGLVLFHDIKITHENFGVWKLWAEIKKQYPRCLEFGHSAGLGILQVAGENKRFEPTWLESGSKSGDMLVKVMEAAGRRLTSNRPGFWRRLERSIRKRRKWLQAQIGFDCDWCPKKRMDAKEAELNPKLVDEILKSKQMFEENFYLKTYPDVEKAYIDPWRHYTQFGHREGRLLSPINLHPKGFEVSMSVVIPTHNGEQKISKTIEAISKFSHGMDIEIIIVNDGSSDQTESVVKALSSKIKNIKLISTKQRGAGNARNTGAKMASKEILLFMGDDISPIGPEFFNVHAVLHKINPQINYSVLGKVEWPKDSYFPITPVMDHITGKGGEQFGYADLMPNSFSDWRFFYTCNVSLKRAVVSDWEAEGFEASFAGCGFEDGEFAYRISKKYGSFNIFYSDQSVGWHYHRHTLLTFFQRQGLCGSQLANLIRLHPQSAGVIGVEEVLKTLNKNKSNDPELAYKTLESIRQIIRFTLDLEDASLLGKHKWHKELLHGVFQIAIYLGFLNAHAKQNQNYAQALTCVFNNAVRPLVPHLPTSFARP